MDLVDPKPKISLSIGMLKDKFLNEIPSQIKGLSALRPYPGNS